MKLTLEKILVKALEMKLESAQQEVEVSEEVLAEFADKLWRGPIGFLQMKGDFWFEVTKPEKPKSAPREVPAKDAKGFIVDAGKKAPRPIAEVAEEWRGKAEKFMDKSVPLDTPDRLSVARDKTTRTWFFNFCRGSAEFACNIELLPFVTDDFKVQLIHGPVPAGLWVDYLPKDSED